MLDNKDAQFVEQYLLKVKTKKKIMSVIAMAIKNKKQFYWVGNEWKELTKTQFQKEFNKAHPLRAKCLLFMGKLIALVFYTALMFLFVTIIYALFKWAIGVWI